MYNRAARVHVVTRTGNVCCLDGHLCKVRSCKAGGDAGSVYEGAGELCYVLLHALFRWDIVRLGIIFNLFQCEMVCGHAAEQWKGREDEGIGWTILSRRVANIFTRI